MRIGIDCRSIQRPGGVGVYTKNLARHLLLKDKENQYVLFFEANISQKMKKSFEQSNCSIRYFPKFKFLPFFYSHFFIASLLKKEGLDLLHSPTGSLPLGYQGKAVVTVHDLVIYKHPEWFPSGQWFSRRIVFPRSIHKAEKIIAVSCSTKSDLVKIFNLPDEKIEIIYEGGIGEQKHKEKLSKQIYSFDYILFIGTLEPRKNLDRLIRAFACYRRQYSRKYVRSYKKEQEEQDKEEQQEEGREKLVIVGGEGWKFNNLYRLVQRLGMQKEIIFQGFVSESQKINLLKNSKALIFPSLDEGFGLPLLEALSLGIPVICSDIKVFREIGNKACYFVDPQNTHSILKGLEKVLGSKALQLVLRQRGKRRAQKFSWQKCAQETIKFYQGAVKIYTKQQ